MSVFRRSDTGKWKYEFAINGHKFSESGFTSRNQAKAAEKERRTSLVGWKPGILFKDAVDQYWSAKGAHHSNSNNEKPYFEFLKGHLGKTEARAIKPHEVGILIKMRAEDGLAPATLNRSITQIVQRVLNFVNVPDPGLSELLFPEEDRVRELTYEEEERLYSVIRPDYIPFLAFSLETGIRKTSQMSLTWSQVDRAAGVIRAVPKGKTAKPYMIPITSAIEVILDHCAQFQTRTVFTYELQRDRGTLKAGTRMQLNRDAHKRVWWKALKEAGIEDYCWHDNRHTAASRALRATNNLALVQKMLDHKDIKTTTKYAHVMIDDLRAGMELVGNRCRIASEEKQNSQNIKIIQGGKK